MLRRLLPVLAPVLAPGLALALALAVAPVPALAQRISGPAVAIDGDTLDMTGMRIRLFGIDAVEGEQTCERGGQAWRCGEEARALLGELVAGKTIVCEQRDTDVYGRMVSVCRAGRLDLAAAMADAGLATALVSFSDAYAMSVERARAQRVGIWGSEFAEPADHRAAHPRADAHTRPARLAAEPAAPAGPAAGIYYRNCAEARAAGAAPLYRGQPGYRTGMDGDGDGVACEPYRGRR